MSSGYCSVRTAAINIIFFIVVSPLLFNRVERVEHAERHPYISCGRARRPAEPPFAAASADYPRIS